MNFLSKGNNRISEIFKLWQLFNFLKLFFFLKKISNERNKKKLGDPPQNDYFLFVSAFVETFLAAPMHHGSDVILCMCACSYVCAWRKRDGKERKGKRKRCAWDSLYHHFHFPRFHLWLNEIYFLKERKWPSTLIYEKNRTKTKLVLNFSASKKQIDILFL